MEKMTVHAEAELGSSMINLHIENADAAQLFAVAEMLHMNATAAFAAQIAQSHAESRPSSIVPVHGRID